MTTHDAPTTPVEVISPDGLQAEPWSADLADAEFARLVKGTKVITPVTRILLAVLVAAAGFIGGVLVERSQQPAASTTASSGAAAFRAGGANAANAGAGAGGAGGASGGATVGTITLVDGSNIYVTTAQGDVVKVVTNPQTAISVSKSGTVADLDPSKTVIVQGTADADGTVTASQITQGGAGFGGAGGGGGRRNGGGGGAGASSASGGG